MTILRRVLASLTLAALVLSWEAPSIATRSPAPPGCPFTSSEGDGAPALVAGNGACDHTDAGPCLDRLGCVTVAPAIALVPTPLVVPSGLITLGTRTAPRLGDLYRTGPPTPPPNQI
jgi:hypothetical protein